MSTEQNTENGNWVPFVQSPLTCSPACAHGEDGDRPEETCNYIHPVWADGPEPVRPPTGQCEDGYYACTRAAATPDSRLCTSCIEDGYGDCCQNCDRPGGRRTSTGYCSKTCQEAAS